MKLSNPQVVIVGGGIVGCSIAFHLVQMGWREILVVDKGPLFENDGSTSHAPGILGLVTGSEMLTRWARRSAALYAELGCWYPVGGLDIALTAATETELRRRHGRALSRGLPARFVAQDEVDALFPHLNHQKIKAALFHPQDGMTHGPTICRALAARCGSAAEFLAHTPVTALDVNQGRMRGVTVSDSETGQSRLIRAERVVLATNIWGGLLAGQAGITIPMLAAQHQYVVTADLPLLADETAELRMPNLRFFDHGIYVRQHHRAYGFGSYDHRPLMVSPADVGQTAIKPFTPLDFAAAWDKMQQLLPACRESDFARSFNGLFGFTVDDYPIIGESAAVPGLWLALGAWVTHAGGVGQTLAHWLATGSPDGDVHAAEANRFHDHQTTRTFILARTAQQYDQHLQVIHPREPWGEPRGIRLAPFHARLVEQGAVCDELAGWEMAQWYGANAPLVERFGGQIPRRDEWSGRHWSPICGAEHLAVRQAAGLFNINGLTRLEVSGPGAAAFLERVCANRVDRPVGEQKIIYTTLLNERGGILADLVVVRLAADRYWLITGTASGPHDLAWLQKRLPGDDTVSLIDISGRWSGLAVWGPRARDVLRPLTTTDLNSAAFPYYTWRWIEIGTIRALALRMSFVGELGWELHVPAAQGLPLWDALWSSGRPHGLIAAGSVVLDSLSKEKGYLIFGRDLHGDVTPYEAGLGWAVRLKNRGFSGRAALLAQKEGRLSRQLCVLTLDLPDGMALGDEPILAGGRPIGYVTSANTGYSIGQHIAYGYLPLAYARPGTALEIEYLGRRQPATVSDNVLFDPHGTRMRA